MMIKKFRRKVSDDEEEEEDEKNQLRSHQNNNNKETKKTIVSKKIITPLSFDNDNDNEAKNGDVEFKVKKSRASKVMKKRLQQPDDVLASLVPAAPQYTAQTHGEYSAENLAALRQMQTFSLPVSDSNSAVAELAGDEAESMTVLTSQLYCKTEADAGDVDVDGDKFMSEESEMLSMQLLKSSKAKCLPHGNDDDDGKRISMTFKPSLSEFVPLSVNRGAKARAEASVFPAESTSDTRVQVDKQQDDDDDDDVDDISWERQLLKRSGTLTSTSTFSDTKLGTSTSTALPGKTSDSGSTTRPARKPTRELGLTAVLGSIHKAVTSLEDSCGVTNRRMQALRVDLEQVHREQARLQQCVDGDASRMSLFQPLRQFFAEVVGLLRDKSGGLEQLQTAAESAASAVGSARRRRRVRRQEDVLLLLREAGELLQLGDYSPTAGLAEAPTASLVGRARVRCSERARRFPRRPSSGPQYDSIAPDSTATTSQSEATISQSEDESYYGCDSDADDNDESKYIDSSERDAEDINSAILLISQGCDALMSDAKEELYSLSELLQQLTKVRSQEPSRYAAAYIPLSLPRLLEPLLRLDVVQQPWITSEVSIAQRPWFTPLLAFSTADEAAGAGREGEGEEGDNDSQLLPKLVLSTVLPWLVSLVTRMFDPLSTKQCNNVLSAATQLLDFDPTPSQLAPLLQALLDSFQCHLRELCVPVVRATSSASVSFVAGQLRCVVKIVRHWGLFNKILAPQVVSKFVLEALQRCQPSMIKVLSVVTSGQLTCFQAEVAALCGEALRTQARTGPESAHNAPYSDPVYAALWAAVSDRPGELPDARRQRLIQSLRKIPT